MGRGKVTKVVSHISFGWVAGYLKLPLFLLAIFSKVIAGMNRDTWPDYILEIKEFGKADVNNDEKIEVYENDTI